jgi:hypothetical protein
MAAINDLRYPRNPASGNVTKPGSIDDFNFIRAQDSTSNTNRITQRNDGTYPQRMPGAWTTRYICNASDQAYNRTELNEWPPSGDGQYNQDRHGDGLERFFGMSFYWPSSSPIPGSGQWAILWQMHAGRSASGAQSSASPTTAIQGIGSRLEVQHRWTGGSDTDTIFNTIPRDVWIDLLVRILFYGDSRGRKTIWAGTAAPGGPFNPTVEINYAGPTRYSGLWGHIQTGVYRSYSTPNNYTLYMHRVRYRQPRSVIEADLWGSSSPPPPPPAAPTIPTTVTATLDAPDRIDWSVVLPSDANRSGLQVAAFPRDPGSDLWIAADAITLYAAATTTGAQTITGESPDLPPGTYTVRAWATGVGGNTGRSASPPITVTTATPGDGQTFINRPLTGVEGEPASAPWDVRLVNQGASAAVAYASEGQGLTVTSQSATGGSSRIVLELEENLSLDFAPDTDDVRVLHARFTVPTGLSEVALYLIDAADTGTTDPLNLDEWVRVLLNMRGTDKVAQLQRRVGGATTVLSSVNLGTDQRAGTNAWLQIAYDRTNVRGAYRFGGVSAAMGGQAAHGLSLPIASLRALVVAFQTASTPSAIRLDAVKLMRRVPAAPTSANATLHKQTGEPWVNGVDPLTALAFIEVEGAFPAVDPGLPFGYRARLASQEVVVPPRDLGAFPIMLQPVPASGTPYTAYLDAGNEAII